MLCEVVLQVGVTVLHVAESDVISCQVTGGNFSRLSAHRRNLCSQPNFDHRFRQHSVPFDDKGIVIDLFYPS
jgi:hypothetical protein